jgi:microcystin-dependent protein
MEGPDYFIGTISIFAGTYAPMDWMLCYGQPMQIRENPALFAVIGNSYGGDGLTTFNLPDLSGRKLIHAGQGAGLSNYAFAQHGGTQALLLTYPNLPAHTHGSPKLEVYRGPFATGFTGDTDSPVDAVPAPIPNTSAYNNSPNDTMGATSLQVISPTAGQGQAISVMSPYIVMNYLIAISGIFPGRDQ